MAPTYKLSYFNVCGLGESVRFLLHAAGQEFEDHRVEGEWAELKSKAPFGQMPLLTVDGDKVLSQSKAINRYLANELGMAGADAWQKACVDMVADRVDDIYSTMHTVYRAEDPEVKKANIVKYLAHVETVLVSLEKRLVANGGGDGFFVGGEMTWADTIFAGAFTFVSKAAVTHGLELPLQVCPKLVALKARVESNPGIAAYIAKRPETSM